MVLRFERTLLGDYGSWHARHCLPVCKRTTSASTIWVRDPLSPSVHPLAWASVNPAPSPWCWRQLGSTQDPRHAPRYATTPTLVACSCYGRPCRVVTRTADIQCTKHAPNVRNNQQSAPVMQQMTSTVTQIHLNRVTRRDRHPDVSRSHPFSQHRRPSR